MDEVPMLRKDRFTNYRTEILMAAVAARPAAIDDRRTADGSGERAVITGR
jgi:hypothetical protein